MFFKSFTSSLLRFLRKIVGCKGLLNTVKIQFQILLHVYQSAENSLKPILQKSYIVIIQSMGNLILATFES
jgi:hypothetical protein